jgi:hypothetical protein
VVGLPLDVEALVLVGAGLLALRLFGPLIGDWWW